MRKLLLYFALIKFNFIVAQPIPECVDITKRLFLTCDNDTLLYLTDLNVPEAIGSKENCFRIRDIKDSLNTKLFKIEIYQSDKYFFKKNEKEMKIFLTNLMLENSFNYYLNITEFVEGTFFIDVSKKKNTKKVYCEMCIDSIDAIDITPKKWKTKKRWKN